MPRFPYRCRAQQHWIRGPADVMVLTVEYRRDDGSTNGSTWEIERCRQCHRASTSRYYYKRKAELIAKAERRAKRLKKRKEST